MTRFSWTAKLAERYFMPGTSFLIEDKFLSGTIKWQMSDEPELFMKPECLGLSDSKESWWVISSGLWCRGQMLFVTMSVLGVRVFLDGAFIKTHCYALASDCMFNSCECKQQCVGICLMNFGFALRRAAGQSANEVLLLLAFGPWHVEALQGRAQRTVEPFAGILDAGLTWVVTTIGINVRRSSTRFTPPRPPADKTLEIRCKVCVPYKGWGPKLRALVSSLRISFEW